MKGYAVTLLSKCWMGVCAGYNLHSVNAWCAAAVVPPVLVCSEYLPHPVSSLPAQMLRLSSLTVVLALLRMRAV